MRSKDAFIVSMIFGSHFIGCIVQSTAGVLHLLTTLVALSASGVLPAVITFFAPVASEVYWFFRIGPTSPYGIIVMVWVCLFVSCLVCMAVAYSVDDE